MSTYITLFNFTQQGLQNIHESPHRAEAFKEAAKKAGVKVTQQFWALGGYDGVVIFEANSDEAATGLILSLEGLGNVNTKTLRGFNAAEFIKIINGAPKM
jgi:uncharacterized protein with GYD domain